MPLTSLQKKIAKLLSINRSPDSHLAGGAALHFAAQSIRFSNDLDFFHDSVERVSVAFENDNASLRANGYTVTIEMKQPGYIRASVTKGKQSTKIEWAHDSSWRFMPALKNPEVGYQLHPIDIAVNKVLALAGRDEARDFLDIIFINEKILHLGPLCWAAVGKDPGFNPQSLLELLRRRGKYRTEDFAPLMLTKKVQLEELKKTWLFLLETADTFVRTQPPKEAGCLYYSRSKRSFIDPQSSPAADATPHFAKPTGVLPRLYNGDLLSDILSCPT